MLQERADEDAGRTGDETRQEVSSTDSTQTLDVEQPTIAESKQDADGPPDGG